MSRILVVAGTDSSGGAGLSRDIAMAQSLGCSVSPVVTAVTVQTNKALIATQPIPPQIIAGQVAAAFDPAGQIPRAIKIGMIGAPDAAQSLAQALPFGVPIVLDPVLKSSSGGALMSLETLTPLLPRVTLLTPNLEESALLAGTSHPSQEPPELAELAARAQIILATGVAAVLIKGGHGQGARSIDHLFTADSHQMFSAPRLPVSKRGTGCSLATALACALAQGAPVAEACAKAKTQMTLWLGSEG
ncbi:bifunctional hydroxymethylpyrimidine kinase/phosphomethylpyrimidine kinase [Pseudophaeobacter arcticus]|uniref:bifunctional hydroxymethylpyrimidine kinase/phosphomethylpyrimidine kinase n=1 Tax=Pseudophaeobacter arcticus TaxID=385492 RepID=UPI002491CF35|nr:hydroxymethylpyrimidine/phosphomethylpyrimidine kinase [Pseudophaeobacter arcticus]